MTHSDNVEGLAESRQARGYASATRLAGAETVERFREQWAGVCPDLPDLVAEFIYGDLHGRPGLGARDRQLATLAALVALGGCEPELRLHIGIGLRAGLTAVEITETILHLSAYAGFPRTLNAMAVAREVLAGAAGYRQE
ncbi:carboxymuconolactone decarboxylase family protein [Hamadaea tsunoensis]|uniref:carboxymuconolactone decarboxylase family protein n=1 Tax=Hamadaea tsunoensis TaxID=53368 RepID=UPI0003FB708A|nr:carboxymuconolactone decarboxylase family protein [Hamadaea tsunoensis]